MANQIITCKFTKFYSTICLEPALVGSAATTGGSSKIGVVEGREEDREKEREWEDWWLLLRLYVRGRGGYCKSGNGGANGRSTERERKRGTAGGEINTLRSPPPGVHGWIHGQTRAPTRVAHRISPVIVRSNSVFALFLFASSFTHPFLGIYTYTYTPFRHRMSSLLPTHYSWLFYRSRMCWKLESQMVTDQSVTIHPCVRWWFR